MSKLQKKVKLRTVAVFEKLHKGKFKTPIYYLSASCDQICILFGACKIRDWRERDQTKSRPNVQTSGPLALAASCEALNGEQTKRAAKDGSLTPSLRIKSSLKIKTENNRIQLTSWSCCLHQNTPGTILQQTLFWIHKEQRRQWVTGVTPAANTLILRGNCPGGGSRTGKRAFNFSENTRTLLYEEKAI